MDSNVSAWSTGGSIFTFASLYVLFIAVAAALYVVYTRPNFFPGHRTGTLKYPAIHTPQPGLPTHVAAPAVPPRLRSPDQPAPTDRPTDRPASADRPAGTEDAEE